MEFITGDRCSLLPPLTGRETTTDGEHDVMISEGLEARLGLGCGLCQTAINKLYSLIILGQPVLLPRRLLGLQATEPGVVLDRHVLAT